MIKGKLVLLNEILFFLILIFMFINDILLYDYIAYSIVMLSIFIKLSSWKIRRKMYDNKKTGYPKKSYKNVIFNVFMTKKEQNLKLRTDWILDLDKIKKKYNIKK